MFFVLYKGLYSLINNNISRTVSKTWWIKKDLLSEWQRSKVKETSWIFMDERVFDHLFQCVYNDDRRRRQVSRNITQGVGAACHARDTWHSSLYKYCHIPWLNWVLTPGLKTSHNPLWSEYARPRNTLLFSAWAHSDYCQPRVSRCPGVWLIHRMPCDKPHSRGFMSME